MLALIDGDIVSYRSAASCEPTRAKQHLEPLEAAIGRADELVRRILYETSADSYRLFIGGETNFRYQIYPEYKANRKDLPRPTYLQEVRAYLVTEFNAEICDGIEADDAMGIAQTNQPLETIICSIDKDLLQVPGNHYNFIKQEHCFIDPLTGLKNFYQQLIQGDQSDHVPGYDGKMRPKIPKFLQPDVDFLWSLETDNDMYRHVLAMYHGDVEIMTRNARLLWIQRKEGDVWNPPQSV